MSKQELLDKLKRQQGKHPSQKINIVAKTEKPKKKTPQDLPPPPQFVLKNQTQMSQSLSEDTYMRKALKFVSSLMTGVGNIDSGDSDNSEDVQEPPQAETEVDAKLLKQAFKVYKNDESKKRDSDEQWSGMTISEKHSLLQEEWKSLPNLYKKDYILQSLEFDSNAPYERKQFINHFRRLPDKLQNLFIRHYLSKTTNYTNLFSSWIRNPSISEAIAQNEQEDEKDSGSKKDVSSVSNIIKSEILKNLTSYLEKKGFKPSPRNTTITSIISEYTIDKQLQDSLYIRVAKNYFNLLEILSGREIVDYISPADLSSEIERMERKYSSKLPSSTLKQIQKLSHNELLKSLEEFKPEMKLKEVSDTVLRILLIFYKSQSSIKSVSTTHALRVARQKLEETTDPEEIAKLQREISFLEYNLPEKEFEKQFEKDFETDERRELISKLSRITSFSESHWNGWTLTELKERYKSIQEGDEFWEQFQKESIIEALMEITGRSRNWYTVMSTDALLEEFERVQNSKYVQEIVPKRVKDSAIYTLKCFKNFQSYNWISGKVQSVWIADPTHTQEQKKSESLNIKPYSESDSILINGVYFFRANKEFFNLQCNKNSKRRIQEGQVLTCFNIHNKPVRFMVGYTISGTQQQLSQYSRKSIKVDSGPYIFVIQDEEIFRQELESLKTVTKSRNEQVAELLKQSVTPQSIEVASRFLSQGLRSVAPQNKDYNQISAYIQIAIKSVLTGPEQTTKDLYSAVASVIVYLNLTDSVIFRKRIESEYYLPDTLMILSPQDKFPEVFDAEFGASDQTKENIVSYITTQSSKIVTDMADFQYRSSHPTITRPWNPINSPEIEKIRYSESVCVNLSDVSDTPKENIVFYTDRDDQTYCFDIDKLADQFNSRNFINPKTGTPFSKDFIRRYTVSYYDYTTKETYTFPFEKLYKQLKSGDIINSKTGTPFDLVFVKNILKGHTFNKSKELRLTKFKRMDYNTSKCENPQDVIDEPIESIIYYIDKVDNKKYCFSIPKLAPIVHDSGINPYTDRRFSKEFLTHFESRYNMVLIQKGFTVSDFGEKYGSQNWDTLETVHDQNIRKLWESYDARKEPIIPDLWNIVMANVIRLETPPPPPPTPPPARPIPPVPPAPPARMGVHKNSQYEYDQSTYSMEDEDDEDDEDEDDDDEDDEDDEDSTNSSTNSSTSSSTSSSAKSSTSSSTSSSAKSSTKSSTKSSAKSSTESEESLPPVSKKSGAPSDGDLKKRPREEESDENMDEEEDYSDLKKAKMVRGEKLGTPPATSSSTPPSVDVPNEPILKCKQCDQHETIFKTFVFVNDKPEVIGFCSTDCACKIDEERSKRHFFKYKTSKKSE